MADSVTKLRGARCAFCARPAVFSLRTAAGEAQEDVGGADKYQPACRAHYVALHRRRSSGGGVGPAAAAGGGGGGGPIGH